MGQHLRAVEPVERQQPTGRKLRPSARHTDDVGITEHLTIKRDVFCFAPVIEFFTHPRTDFLGDFAGIDRRAQALADRKQPLQLHQVGFDRRLHVGILQLAGQLRAIVRHRAMHLAERCGRGRVMLEARKLLRPVGAKLSHHAAFHESPAHRRRFALQLLQFGGVFRWQQIGNGRHQLGDLHQRTFEPAKRRRQRACFAGTIRFTAQKAPAGVTRSDTADVGTDPCVARGSRREAVLFAVAATLVLRFIGHIHHR